MENLEGLMIEYFEADGLQYGYVIKHNINQVHVLNLKGRKQKFPINRIVVVHKKINESEFKHTMEEYESSISVIRNEIDVELLWEMVKDNSDTYTLDDLSDIYFNVADSKQKSALIKAIRDNRLCFRLKGLLFTPRTQEQKEELANSIEIENRKSEYVNKLKALYFKIAGNTFIEPDPVEHSMLQDIYNYHFRRCDYFYSNELKLLNRSKDENEIIIEILYGSGFISADTDRFVALAGLPSTFSKQEISEADLLVPYKHDKSRLVINHKLCMSIDDAGTTEIDDAISLDYNENVLTVGIHIADVQYFVKKNSVLDKTARDRCSSLYLETGAVPMLPPRLSSLHTSLVENEARPVLSYIIEYDMVTKQILSKNVYRGEVIVNKKLTYDYADELLDSGEGELALALLRIEELCIMMRKKRFENGAIEILRPEVQLKVEENDILINNINRWSRSRRLIGELMIFINNLAGQFCRDNNIPSIYRVQDKPEHPIPELGDNSTYDPVVTDRLIRFIRPSRISTAPSEHSGLGIDAYSQLSCPIRRYADLVVQRQVSAFLLDDELSYSNEELFSIIAEVEEITKKHRAMYQESSNYWYLKYLQKFCLETSFIATVVYMNRSRVTFELDTFGKRTTVNINEKELSLGDKVELSIEKIEPDKGILKFKID